MKNKNDIRDELKELSPFLAERKYFDEGFNVPKDYFRSLPDEVMKLVRNDAAPVSEPRRNWFDEVAGFVQSFFQPRYALAYAAVAILIVAGIYTWQPSETLETSPSQIAEIETEAIENYLAENIDVISTDWMEAEYAEFSRTVGEADGTEILPEMKVEELEEYLGGELDEINLSDFEDLL